MLIIDEKEMTREEAQAAFGVHLQKAPKSIREKFYKDRINNHEEDNVRKPKEIWAIIETRCSVDGTSSIRDLGSDIYGDIHYSSLDAEASLNVMYEEYLRINKTMNLGLILDLTHDEDGKNPIFRSRFLRRCAGCPDVETIVTYTIKKLEVSV